MRPREVAQFGSALRSGRRGRGFKSPLPDQEQRTFTIRRICFDLARVANMPIRLATASDLPQLQRLSGMHRELRISARALGLHLVVSFSTWMKTIRSLCT
jgi:hypothetical protein